MIRHEVSFVVDAPPHRVWRLFHPKPVPGAEVPRTFEHPNGTITTVAGNGTQGFSGDGGPATAAALNNPTALTTDSAGNLYITDQFNHRIRRVDSRGVIQTVAGNGTSAYGGDGGPATSARFSFPGSVALDAAGTQSAGARHDGRHAGAEPAAGSDGGDS